ncbi:MAG: hypothetical protein HOH66_14250 [Rhodospirillaceae bacterium]|nr:hypothetical protein [Rhodospirillaceae bacterium]
MSSAIDYDRPEKTDVIPSERVVFRPQPQVWMNVVNGLKAGFIPVTAMRGSPDDGLLMVDFSLDDPENFANCGEVVTSYAGDGAPRVVRASFLVPETYRVFRTSVLGIQRIDAAGRGDFRLTGTANMLISPIDARQTLVSVKVNYTLHYNQYTQEETAQFATAEPRSAEFSTHFTSGGEPVCYSKGAMEISLLDLSEDGSARLLRPCLIKGIVRPGGAKVYFAPGHPLYESIQVTETPGGLWFCSAEQAVAAGWVEAGR